MKKVLGLVAVAVAAGAAIFVFKGRHPNRQPAGIRKGSQGADVQKSLSALDRRVRELTAQVQSLRESSGRQSATAGEGTQAADDSRRFGGDRPPFGAERSEEQIKAMRERMQERDNERVKAAGLTPERMRPSTAAPRNCAWPCRPSTRRSAPASAPMA